MPKLLLEYKNIPCIFNHNLVEVDKVSYIVVYKEDDYVFKKKTFKHIQEALEYETSNSCRIVFIYLQSPTIDAVHHVEYGIVDFARNQLTVASTLSSFFGTYYNSIEFGLDSFTINKKKNSTSDAFIQIHLKRRVSSNTLLDSFYEIIPRFEDMFLETLFIWDIMRSHVSILNRDKLEAYLMQAKYRVETLWEGSDLENHDDEEVDETVEQKEVDTIPLSIDSLIGLEKVKLEIRELQTLASFRKKRLEMSLPVTPNTLHLVFTGNPGTGKTTVARLLGKIYFDIGLLNENKVTEVSRKDLVGEYVGHTGPKTEKVFKAALGGILFIDEAYSLFKGSPNDFGAEAVETILKLMEDHREDIVVIIAGYPSQIEELLSSNPGLKSRFSKTIHFDDYSKEELLEIFLKMVSDYRNKLTDGAKYKMEFLIDQHYESGYFNSNARSVRNIFEDAAKRQSSRISKVENPTQEEMVTFTDKDLMDTLN